jgi:hypothetical protein
MIGVVCEYNEREVVQEFFELFKTPWEFFVEDRAYEIIISTTSKIPYENAKVCFVYGPLKRRLDGEARITSGLIRKNIHVNYKDKKVPVYSDVLTFQLEEQSNVTLRTDYEVVGLIVEKSRTKIYRVGYNLFEEVRFLLSSGQPAVNGWLPTLEVHISMLREWILDSWIPLVEVPPVPAGYDFIACLTHDVDFVGIKNHRLDHTMWGFVFRASIGSGINFLKGRLSLAELLCNWKAVISLPLVYTGLAKDFWLQFEKLIQIEKGLESTYYFVPFRDRSGEKVRSINEERRATKYDISEVHTFVKDLQALGFEVGVHGIDAWHSYEKGLEELERIVKVTGKQEMGIRIHWLYFDEESPRQLEKAGFYYDSTFGYNETVGYRAGTAQVFKPLGVNNLLEVPLHIQDTALFNPKRLHLKEDEAWRMCSYFLENLQKFGGVLTILWHLRSLAPERLWGDFYVRLLEGFKARRAWITSARRVVEWFSRRRGLKFEEAYFFHDRLRLNISFEANRLGPNLRLRIHMPSLTKGERGNYLDMPLLSTGEIEIPLNSDKKVAEPKAQGAIIYEK